jgi:hypothetical protein
MQEETVAIAGIDLFAEITAGVIVGTISSEASSDDEGGEGGEG